MSANPLQCKPRQPLLTAWALATLITLGVLAQHACARKSAHAGAAAVELVVNLPHGAAEGPGVGGSTAPAGPAATCSTVPLPAGSHGLAGMKAPRAGSMPASVHRITLHGCSSGSGMGATAGRQQQEGGSSMPPWRCREPKSICGNNSTAFVLYIWQRGAGKGALGGQSLLQGASYCVGPLCSFQTLVAQVHGSQEQQSQDDLPWLDGPTLVLQAAPMLAYSSGILSLSASQQPAAASDGDSGGGGVELPRHQNHQRAHEDTAMCCYRSQQRPVVTGALVQAGPGASVTLERLLPDGNGTVERLLHLELGSAMQSVQQLPAPHTLLPGDRVRLTCSYAGRAAEGAKSSPPPGGEGASACSAQLQVRSALPLFGSSDTARVHSSSGGGKQQQLQHQQPAGAAGAPQQWRYAGSLPEKGRFVRDTTFWKPPVPDDGAETGGKFGHASGVSVAPDGTLWVFYRRPGAWGGVSWQSREPAQEALVVQLDPDTGAVLRRWGAGLFHTPHMITADWQGNLWMVDVVMHQIFKFSPDGQLLMTLGNKYQPGKDKYSFNMPSHVRVLRDGSFLVADGYENQRVVKYDSSGKYIAESPTLHPSWAPVHVTLADECAGLVYVTLREASEVHVLDLHTMRNISKLGPFWEHNDIFSLRFGPNGELLALTNRQVLNTTAKVINIHDPSMAWELLGSDEVCSHDFEIGAAHPAFSHNGDRLLAVYVANVGKSCRDNKCGPIRKYVLVPEGHNVSLEMTAAAADLYIGWDSESDPGTLELGNGGVLAELATNPHQVYAALAMVICGLLLAGGLFIYGRAKAL